MAIKKAPTPYRRWSLWEQFVLTPENLAHEVGSQLICGDVKKFACLVECYFLASLQTEMFSHSLHQPLTAALAFAAYSYHVGGVNKQSWWIFHKCVFFL
jgi:hypothetical protein